MLLTVNRLSDSGQMNNKKMCEMCESPLGELTFHKKPPVHTSLPIKHLSV